MTEYLRYPCHYSTLRTLSIACTVLFSQLVTSAAGPMPEYLCYPCHHSTLHTLPALSCFHNWPVDPLDIIRTEYLCYPCHHSTLHTLSIACTVLFSQLVTSAAGRMPEYLCYACHHGTLHTLPALSCFHNWVSSAVGHTVVFALPLPQPHFAYITRTVLFARAPGVEVFSDA